MNESRFRTPTGALRAWVDLSIIALAFGILTVAGIAYTARVQREARGDLVECVSEWADESSARTSVLTAASNKRNDAYDAFMLSLGKLSISTPQTAAKNRREAVKRLNELNAASAAFKAAQKAHPVPEAPRLRC